MKNYEPFRREKLRSYQKAIEHYETKAESAYVEGNIELANLFASSIANYKAKVGNLLIRHGLPKERGLVTLIGCGRGGGQFDLYQISC